VTQMKDFERLPAGMGFFAEPRLAGEPLAVRTDSFERSSS